MVVHIENTHTLYHVKPNQIKRIHTKPYKNQTKYPFNRHNSVNFETRSLKFYMVVHINKTHILYHTTQKQTKPNYILQNQTKYDCNGHNSIIFEGRSSIFCIILHIWCMDVTTPHFMLWTDPKLKFSNGYNSVIF